MKRWLVGILTLVVVLLGSHAVMTDALTLSSSGNVPVTAVVPGPPPTTPAVIVSPNNGVHVQTTPLVVSGTCGVGLMVRVFDNNQLAGSVMCEADGTFIMNITLDIGNNVLTALNYDTLDQPGPASAVVLVIVDAPTNSSTAQSTPKNGAQQANKKANAIDDLQPYTRQTLLDTTIIGSIFWFIDLHIQVSAWVNWVINILTLITILAIILFVLRRRRIDKTTSV